MNRAVFAVFLIAVFASVSSEELTVEPGERDTLNLDKTIISGTLRISDGENVLEAGKDFRFEDGKIIFTDRHESLLVQFESAEPGIKRVNRLYEKKKYREEDEIGNTDTGNAEDIYVRGGNGIVLGLSESSGIELNQTLDIAVDGVLSDRWRVRGSIYDNSGISSSGTVNLPITQLENISISVFDSVNVFKLGNQSFSGSEGRFTGMSREMIGLSYSYSKEVLSLSAAAASQKGKIKSVRIRLMSDVWGPYALTEEQTLYDYVIAPGSENIYLDGVLLWEGRDKDYTIDYKTGELTLTNRVDVDSTKYIYAEFQTYEYFSPLTGYYSAGSLYGGGVKYVFMREEQNISDAGVRDKLKYASSDTSYIISSGETYVGAGEGDYFKSDSIFIYAGSGEGAYDVDFVYTGYGRGDYIYSPVINGYVYAGKGAGLYLPYRKIDLPFESDYFGVRTEHRLGSGVISAGAGGGFYSYNRYAADKKYIKDVSYEAGYTTDKFSLNRFSVYGSADFAEKSLFFREVWAASRPEDISFSENVNSGISSGRELSLKTGISYENIADAKIAVSYIDTFIQKSAAAESDTIFGFFAGISGKNISRADTTVYEKRNASVYKIIGNIVGGGYAEQEFVQGTDYIRKSVIIRNLSSTIKAAYRNEKGSRNSIQLSDQDRYIIAADVSGFTASAEYRQTEDMVNGTDKNLLIGDAAYTGKIAEILNLRSSASVTNLTSYKATEVYIYAGKGKGDYIYDSESGLYIEDKYEGEYVKIIQMLPAESPLSNRSADLSASLTKAGWNLSLSSRYSDAAERVTAFSQDAVAENEYNALLNIDYRFASGVSPYASADIFHNGRIENYESDDREVKAGILYGGENISSDINASESYESRIIGASGYEHFRTERYSVNVNPVSTTVEYDITFNVERFFADYSYGSGDQSLMVFKLEAKPSFSFLLFKNLKLGINPSVSINTYSGNDNPPLSIYYRYPEGFSYSGYAYAVYTKNNISISVRYTSEMNDKFGYRQKAEASVYTYF